jgi:cysteine desulfurase/selenocysteine lyase
MVAVVHLSNSLGTVNPVVEIINRAHEKGAVVLIDGAQWVAHATTDVQALGADFYAFSGHKLYGPTGIGVLYAKAKLLEAMPPYQGGGDMIASVTFERTTYAMPPHKFEAGTPHIEGGIGLGAAIDFVNSVGLERIAEHARELLKYGTEKLLEVPGLRLIGTARNRGSVLSFVLEDPPISSLDIGTMLDGRGIAVRTGHHCCQPVMDRFSISSTARASLAMYNTKEEIDFLAASLMEIVKSESTKAPRAIPAAGSSAEEQWPGTWAATPKAAAEKLAEEFDLLGDWESRHDYLVELGEKLLPLPTSARTEANRVRGCMSLVHLIARKRPGSEDVLEFLADSDAQIVRGLIALLQRVYSGQPARAVLDFDPQAMLKRLGLDEHLSMGRRNGLAGMIQRIRHEASKILAGDLHGK